MSKTTINDIDRSKEQLPGIPVMDCQGEHVDYTLSSEAQFKTPTRVLYLQAMLERAESERNMLAQRLSEVSAERSLVINLLEIVLKMLDAKETPAVAPPAVDVMTALATHDRQRGFKAIP